MSQQPAQQHFLMRHIWVIAALVGMACITVFALNNERKLTPLPHQYQTPSFTLTHQEGQTFESKSLAGKVWIAGFIFTSCRTECPIIGREMEKVAAKLKDTQVQLVTFTVDPEWDTPERLRDWGRTYHVDPTRWHLLTGSRQEMERVVAQGFKSAMGDKPTETQRETNMVDVAHSFKLALVDHEGWIRYYFDVNNPEAMSLIVDHARNLEKEAAEAIKVPSAGASR